MRLLHASGLLLMLGALQPLSSQVVVGELVDSAGQPVRAARMVLVDSLGVTQASMLTDAAGRFRIPAVRAGRHTVRAERVGFAATRSGPLRLEPGQVTQIRLVASTARVTLEGITARGSRRCTSAAGGAATARTWEEARKALAAAEEALASRSVRHEYVLYRRELVPGSLAIRSDRRTTAAATVANLFSSVPVDSLVEQGFVRPRRDSVAWDAPDGRVLLSRRFLDTHCFHIVGHPDSAALVGLGFRPTPGRRLPEVEGTLWLNRSTAELRHLEYRYINAGAPARHAQVGGRLEFERLPTGYWLVQRWWIRMPTASPREVFPEQAGSDFSAFRQGRLLSGLIEVGGEVVAAGSQRLGGAGGGVRISGVVWDSLRSRALPGAVVSVAGTARSSVTDSTGAFLLEGLPAGRHTLSFTHPILAVAGATPRTAIADVPVDSARSIVLAVPADGASIVAHCDSLAPARSLIAGLVSSGAAPVPGAEVSVQWTGLANDERGIDQPRLATRTLADGSFVVCDVPQDRRLQLRVRWGDRADHASFVLRGSRVYFHEVRF